MTRRDGCLHLAAGRAAVHSPSTPLMLVLGPDALTWFRDAMKELNADVDAWERTSLNTSFPG
jgi:hypothetical protein